MYVQLACGNCDSGITIDAEDDMAAVSLDLLHRFNEAHVECGFIAPPRSGDSTKMRDIQPFKTDDLD
jgi:hypothetical protein